MARCEVCGNDYDKSFEVRLATRIVPDMRGESRVR